MWEQRIEAALAGVPEEMIDIGTQHSGFLENALRCLLDCSQGVQVTH